MTSETTRQSIVLVDNEADLVQLFTDALKSVGLDTVPFDNSIKALEYIRRFHSNVSLVLTDWKMPQMNGLELTKRVSEIDENIEILLMSAFELEQDQLKEVNKSDYLRKPIHMNQLIDAVKKQVYSTITH